MDWLVVVERSDLSVPAKKLARIIVERYAQMNTRYAQFADTELPTAMRTNEQVALSAKRQLVSAGYLVRLQFGVGQKPMYAMHMPAARVCKHELAE
jgi:hypothetical protein